MDLFSFLKRYQKRRKKFFSGEEYNFYLTNRLLMTKMPRFSYLVNNFPSEFDIMRMNILFHAYHNKKAIETEVISFEQLMDKESKAIIHKALKEKLVDLPYYKNKKVKIYMPFFTEAVNNIYVNEPMKLLKYPYSALKDDFAETMIDPFDCYGYELYNSYFTRLIKVEEKEGCAAFFHYDTNTIYIINDQGRLDQTIVLFDKFIVKPNYNHMLERIKPVIDSYFSCDRNTFIESLRENNFISTELYYLIKLFEWRRHR